MGFKAKRKIFHLVFSDEDMEGLRVTIRSTSMENILLMAEMDEMTPTALTKEDIAKLRSAFDIVSQSMVSWNLEDEDGVAIPATVASLLDQEPEFVMSIIKAWTRAMTQVAAPLAPPSQDGEQFPEGSIPMENLSESQVS